MFSTLRRRAFMMVFETSKPFVASTRSNGFNFRTINHLATNEMKQRTYEEAIDALNGLQSNTSKIKDSISRIHNNENPNVKSTELYLKKVGIELDDLDKLSVIHVAGTKGKGSTCALAESVLRNLNVKTGFFSSPHLLSVTERIQINGEPISEDTFSQYFWNIYNQLDALKKDASDMPPYFKFLTVLAYHIFLNEKVDVAVIEVGIGGEYDCTNVLRNTRTVGIASLGLDHTQLLGNTYRDIAWQKSGIIKPGSSVYSTRQHDECIPVLLDRSKEKNATIKFVPKFSEYQYDDKKVLDEIASNPTKLRNSSLAIQLCYDWIRLNESKIENKSVCEHLSSADGGMTLKKEIAEGLVNCQWPGRCQTLTYENLRIHIDGAHTMDSLQLCVDWFNKSTYLSSNKKILIFNITGARDANEMLKFINQNVKFTEALFTPNILSISEQATDNKLTVMPPNRSKEFSKHWIDLSSDNKAQAFDCVSDVFDYLHTKYQNDQVTVLVTGSLHLVGEVLRLIKI